MPSRKASIKETGEELSQADWERFDAAVAAAKVERGTVEPMRREGPAPIRKAVVDEGDEAASG